MSLFDEFLNEQGERRPYQLCTMAKIRAGLSPEDQVDLDRALADRRFTATAIARRLNKLLGEGAFGVKGHTVMRHRNGNCTCQR